MKLDLHTHTLHSRDSNIKPETYVMTYKKLGIVPAVTDHNTIGAWNELKQLSKKHNIPVIFGEEVKIFEEKKCIGELLCFFLEKEIQPGELWTVIEDAKSQNAFISVAHPFDKFRNSFKYLEEVAEKKAVNAVEVFNARSYTEKANSKALDFAVAKELGTTAGSDSHIAGEMGKAFVEVNADSLEEARKLLEKGKVKVHGRRSSILPHFKTQLVKHGLMKDV